MIIRGIFDAVLEYDPAQEACVREKGTVVVFPGGGYSWLSDRESWPVVRAFNREGYRAVIFRYDVQTEVLRQRPVCQAAWACAEVKRLYPGEPVYFCGFSAGAHCAATLGVHWADTDWNGKPLFREVKEYCGMSPETDKRIFRPDGMILAYPVITGGEYAHRGSFDRLLGSREQYAAVHGSVEEYDRALHWFSLELQVRETAVPCYVWHTETDLSVPVQNTLLLIGAYAAQGIPAEYHLFPRGVHGLSLADEETEEKEKGRYRDPHVAEWFSEAAEWIRYI